MRTQGRSGADVEVTRENLRRMAQIVGTLGLPSARQALLNQAAAVADLPPGAPQWVNAAIAILRVEFSLEEALFRSLGRSGENLAREFVEIETQTPHGQDLREAVVALIGECLVELSQVKTAVDAYQKRGEPVAIVPVPQRLRDIVAAMKILAELKAGIIIAALHSYIVEGGLAAAKNEPVKFERFADAVCSIEVFFEAVRDGLPSPEAVLDEAATYVRRLRATEGAAVPPVSIELDFRPVYDLPPTEEPAAVELAAAQPAPVSAPVGEGIDPEIREIFIEEAAEVLKDLQRRLPQLRREPNNQDWLAEVRRAFHTLKGSGRMAGALRIGEFGWALEDLSNRCRDGALVVSPAVLDLFDDAARLLPKLIENFRAGADGAAGVGDVDASAVIDRATALIVGGDARGLLEIFRDDARERMLFVQRWIDAQPAFTESVSVEPEVTRAFHTLKGSAGAVQLHGVHELASALEKYLSDVSESGYALPAAALALLADALRAIQQRIGSTDAAEIDEAALAGWRERIHALLPPETDQAASAIDDAFCMSMLDALQALETQISDWQQTRAGAASLPVREGFANLADRAETAGAKALAAITQAITARLNPRAENAIPDTAFFPTLRGLCEALYQQLDAYHEGTTAPDLDHCLTQAQSLAFAAPTPAVEPEIAPKPELGYVSESAAELVPVAAPVAAAAPMLESIPESAPDFAPELAAETTHELAREIAPEIAPEIAHEPAMLPVSETSIPAPAPQQTFADQLAHLAALLAGLDRQQKLWAEGDSTVVGELRQGLQHLSGVAQAVGFAELAGLAQLLAQEFERIDADSVAPPQSRVAKGLEDLHRVLAQHSRGEAPDAAVIAGDIHATPLAMAAPESSPAAPALVEPAPLELLELQPTPEVAQDAAEVVTVAPAEASHAPAEAVAEPSSQAEASVATAPAEPEASTPAPAIQSPSLPPLVELIDLSLDAMFDDASAHQPAESEALHLAGPAGFDLADSTTPKLPESPSLDLSAELLSSTEAPAAETSAELPETMPSAVETASPATLDPAVEPTVSSVPEPAQIPIKPEVDRELVDIFAGEAGELLEQLDAGFDAWQSGDGGEPLLVVQRVLHTLKGGARMSGFDAMGDAAHDLESQVNAVAASGVVPEVAVFARLRETFDNLLRMYDQMRSGDSGESAAMPADAASAASAASLTRSGWLPEMFWRPQEESSTVVAARRETARVPVETLDAMLNQASEISIYRSRVEDRNANVRAQLVEMSQTITRLRDHLRQMESETEAQIAARGFNPGEAIGVAVPDRYGADFDPLEMDRFSRMQELSRALAESVNDLVVLQTAMDESVRETDTLLQQQSRLNTEVQHGLTSTLMVPFSRQVQRLRRVVRQTAQENGKQADIEFIGADAELDRNVLERITAPLEHLLRNAIVHGIEDPTQRAFTNKPMVGTIRISLQREGSQLRVEVSDDGAGLNLQAIRKLAIERGMLAPKAQVSDGDLARFIFKPGFSTAKELTQDAGRGIGMEVVASEVKQLGGTLELRSEAGAGTSFLLNLPLTLAVSQALMIGVGEEVYALPMASVEGIARIPRADLDDLLADDGPLFAYAGRGYRVRMMSDYLELPRSQDAEARSFITILVRLGDNLGGGERRIALLIDQLIGNRDIVTKPLGAQLGSVPGVSGATVLADGRVVLILDLAALIAEHARRTLLLDAAASTAPARSAEALDLIMVVDDSVTMRRVAERLLQRNGYRVITARDGLDAIAQLQTETPAMLLLDIEMPRADGFEVAAFVRANPRLADLPIIMITSRSGEKHRERARQLGVNSYLTKPYQEDNLLAEVKSLRREPTA
jgi:chemosensory pili system protein ChpA (sensor histidine kinase/response regulator)